MKTSTNLSDKRQSAIEYLRSRGKYILDRNTPPPGWKADESTEIKFQRVYFTCSPEKADEQIA